MKVCIRKKQGAALSRRFSQYREWRAVEAPSRQEVNDLKRDRFQHVVTEDGIEYWGR